MMNVFQNIPITVSNIDHSDPDTHAHAVAMAKNEHDLNKPAGWMVRASVLGGMVQTFYVYELDDNRAAELVKIAIAATNGETVEAVKLLNIHELEGHGLKPGDVRQYV
jgi:hypothetical protein